MIYEVCKDFRIHKNKLNIENDIINENFPSSSNLLIPSSVFSSPCSACGRTKISKWNSSFIEISRKTHQALIKRIIYSEVLDQTIVYIFVLKSQKRVYYIWILRMLLIEVNFPPSKIPSVFKWRQKISFAWIDSTRKM